MHTAILQRRRLLTIAATAVAAILIALLPSIVSATKKSGHTQPTEPFSSRDYVGYRWVLTEVRDEQHRTTVPARRGGYVDFRRDGVLAANNGINALTAHYSTSGRSFSVTNVGTTYTGYAGGDPTRDAVIAALNALSYGNRGGIGDGAAHDSVHFVTATQITVNADALQLTFHRAGEAPDQLLRRQRN